MRVLATIVRALLLWLLGIIAAHSPKLYDLAQAIIGDLGGNDVVVISIVGALSVLGTAVYSRLRSRINFLTALDAHPGSSEETVKREARKLPLSAAFETKL